MYQLNHLVFDVGVGRSRTDEQQLILFLFSPEVWWEDLGTFIREELKISEDLFIFNEGPAVPTLPTFLFKNSFMILLIHIHPSIKHQ